MPDYQLVPVDHDPFNMTPAGQPIPFGSMQSAYDAAVEHQRRWGMPSATEQIPGIIGGTGRFLAEPLMAGPHLMGDVMEGRLNPSSPEAIRRSADAALGVTGAGMFGAERGAIGAGGGAIKAYHGSPDYSTLLKSHGPEFANATIIDHQGNVLHNPIARESVGGSMLRINEDGSVTRGILAYHGSPHDFDRFDLSKIGTGEGAQAYGHGLYFAENPKVAEEYKSFLPRNPADQIAQEAEQEAAWQLKNADGNHAIALRRMQQTLDEGYDEITSKAMDILERGESPKEKTGRMYQVAINADPEHFLDWDKPLSEQHPNIQKLAAGEFYASSPKRMKEFMEENGHETGSNTHDTFVYRLMKNEGLSREDAIAEVPNRLRAAGIPGIKYLDQGSRGDPAAVQASIARAQSRIETAKKSIAETPGYNPDYHAMLEKEIALQQGHIARDQAELQRLSKQTSNYVVFDDKLIDIIKKYGLAGLSALPAAGAYHFRTQQVDHDPFASQ